MRWSGACPEGPAAGPGTAEWHWTEQGEAKITTVTGYFVAGKLQGRGKAISPEGLYEGEWRDGRPEGWGTAVFADGRRYQGLWRDGKPHGEGTLERQDWRYEGRHLDGRPHGPGTLTLPDGTRYDGEWRDGKPEGYGELYTARRGSIRGLWRGGCIRQPDNRKAAIGIGLRIEDCR